MAGSNLYCCGGKPSGFLFWEEHVLRRNQEAMQLSVQHCVYEQVFRIFHTSGERNWCDAWIYPW